MGLTSAEPPYLPLIAKHRAADNSCRSLAAERNRPPAIVVIVTAVLALPLLTACELGQRYCDQAGELAQDAQLAAAAETYAMAELHDEGRCASDGLDTVAAKRAEAYVHIARGRAAESVGDMPAARTWYGAALQMDASDGQAAMSLAGVAERPADVDPAWAGAVALVAEGLDDHARDEIARVLREHPEMIVPQALAHIPADAAEVTNGDRNSSGTVKFWALVVITLAAVVVGGTSSLLLSKRTHGAVESLTQQVREFSKPLAALDSGVKSLQTRAVDLSGRFSAVEARMGRRHPATRFIQRLIKKLRRR